MLQSSVVLCRMLQSSVVSHATEQRLLQSKRVALFLWRGVVVVCCLRWYHVSCVCVYAHIVLSGPSEMMMMMMFVCLVVLPQGLESSVS